MIQNDQWIEKQALNGMIDPFEPQQIRQIDGVKVISYGLSSFGYDIRLSPDDFRVFRHIPGEIVDPKNFDPNFLEQVKLHQDFTGDYFIIPAHSYGLGVAIERLAMPRDVTAICMGKSTFARVGLIANVTPVESGWEGHLTLEFSNSSNTDCKIYANEGVVQLLFLKGEPCLVTYRDRAGKYQNQNQEVTLPRL